ncbi:MAG TPA: reverse transcriptase-like protein [Candidatus Thermoplasmatota archaeon]|nr:reverse transcriptase-like protein [Candidatus Thermoplasmatota archaeon]
MSYAFVPLPDERDDFPLPVPRSEVHVFADGSADKGVEARYAFVVMTPDGAVLHEERGRAALNRGATNNVAEYVAVIKALKFLKAHGLVGIVHTDSMNVKRCVTGEWECRPGILKPLCEKAQSLLEATGSTILWIPRSLNKHADALTKARLR